MCTFAIIHDMLYLILAPLFFGITLIFIKLATAKISPIVGNILFLVAAFIVQFLTFLFFKFRGDHFAITAKGLWLSGMGGIFLGLYTVFLFQTFSQVGITEASPVVYIGAIIISVLFGLIFLKEPLSAVNIAGIVLACFGLALIFIK